MAKRRLGRGLNALIPELPPLENQGIQEISINDVAPGRNQPRQRFDTKKMEELAESISKHGVVQPIAIRKIDKGYEIVAGERRWRGARMAGLTTIPAVIMELDERQVMEVALVENLQREDLNPIEEAEAYKTLMEEFELTQDQIAAAVGKSRPAIANTLRLLNLSGDIKDMVKGDQLTAGHARALVTLGDRDQKEIAERVLKEDLSVRETERLIGNIAKESKKKGKTVKVKKPWIVEIEEIVGEILGTKVQITQGRKKGKIEIEYYSQEDLERILDLIKM